MNQNTSSKDFWKPSVLVWHGLNTNVSQIKKKKVGAWPLCFFLIVAYIIYVFHFSFDISLRKKIFFLWCHTNTHGIDLRRTPQKWNGKKTAPGSMSSVVITWHSVSLCSYLKSSYDDTTLGKAMLPVLVKCILIIGAKNTKKYTNTSSWKSNVASSSAVHPHIRGFTGREICCWNPDVKRKSGRFILLRLDFSFWSLSGNNPPMNQVTVSSWFSQQVTIIPNFYPIQ